MADPRRLQCLEAMQTAFQSMAPPAWDFAFDQVQIGPLPKVQERKRHSVGIVAARETKIVLFPVTDALAEVNLELRMQWNTTDTDLPGIVAERFLAQVSKVVANNTNLGGLAIDWKELGSELQLVSWMDRAIEAVIFTELRYRHATLDPYAPA